MSQTDYWDSIDLNQGSYARSSDAVQDFVNQLLGGSKTSEASCPGRCAAGLFCERHPAVSVMRPYDVRPRLRYARVVYRWV